VKTKLLQSVSILMVSNSEIMTNLVRHVSHLVFFENGFPSNLWWGCLSLLDLLLIWPREEGLSELSLEYLLMKLACESII
jgi:hypothetical protein